VTTATVLRRNGLDLHATRAPGTNRPVGDPNDGVKFDLVGQAQIGAFSALPMGGIPPHRNAKVRGSIPLGSTNIPKRLSGTTIC
jgi:hypothetical protein